MNFKERLHNTIISHVEDLHYHLVTKKTQRNLYKELFPNAKKSFDEMYHSPSVIFLNSHVAALSPRPYMQNMIEIGGIHIEPAKELPKDMKDFMDSANDGVIYFSMGSVLKSVQWPEEKLQAILKALEKLKQKVIWKYEDPTLPNKPKNVMISPWLPQRDIFAHPNLKVFITHGGLLGTSEALVEGIPLLGLPIFGDQKMNIAYAVDAGYALQVYFHNITEETISLALNELINNPKYRENAKIASERYNDRPMTPNDAVVYWTEYAYKHKGAPHLRTSAAFDLSYFEVRSLDVYLVIGAVLILLIKIKLFIVKTILRKLFKKSESDKKNKRE
jgi:glucuronosyltransferase